MFLYATHLSYYYLSKFYSLSIYVTLTVPEIESMLDIKKKSSKSEMNCCEIIAYKIHSQFVGMIKKHYSNHKTNIIIYFMLMQNVFRWRANEDMKIWVTTCSDVYSIK